MKHVIVLERLGADVPMTPGRDITWDELRVRGEKAEPGGVEPEDTGAEDALMIAYTSGTTGKPKGAVHVHGGFLVKMASETAYQTDLHPDETLYWVTDMGWIMGPLGDGRRAARSARRWSCTRARRTGPSPTACGRRSSGTASTCSASRRR